MVEESKGHDFNTFSNIEQGDDVKIGIVPPQDMLHLSKEEFSRQLSQISDSYFHEWQALQASNPDLPYDEVRDNQVRRDVIEFLISVLPPHLQRRVQTSLDEGTDYNEVGGDLSFSELVTEAHVYQVLKAIREGQEIPQKVVESFTKGTGRFDKYKGQELVQALITRRHGEMAEKLLRGVNIEQLHNLAENLNTVLSEAWHNRENMDVLISKLVAVVKQEVPEAVTEEQSGALRISVADQGTDQELFYVFPAEIILENKWLKYFEAVKDGQQADFTRTKAVKELAIGTYDSEDLYFYTRDEERAEQERMVVVRKGIVEAQ